MRGAVNTWSQRLVGNASRCVDWLASRSACGDSSTKAGTRLPWSHRGTLETWAVQQPGTVKFFFCAPLWRRCSSSSARRLDGRPMSRCPPQAARRHDLHTVTLNTSGGIRCSRTITIYMLLYKYRRIIRFRYWKVEHKLDITNKSTHAEHSMITFLALICEHHLTFTHCFLHVLRVSSLTVHHILWSHRLLCIRNLQSNCRSSSCKKYTIEQNNIFLQNVVE